MRITGEYPGGNIEVVKIDGDTVHLANQLRDTTRDWFYWAFRVEGAQGRTLVFTFDGHNYISYWGAAVSRDGEAWSGEETARPDGFTYTFGSEDDCLYFCHDFNYPLKRFERVAKELSLPVSTLTKSEQGRDVPLVCLGTEGPALLLTARHHCCESPGSYLMEGLLREFSQYPPLGFRVLAVPFVDLDGVVNGDQGKSRAPHDHNRDYIDEPIYQSTAAIMKLADSEDIHWLVDLHAPGHQGVSHDYCYFMRIINDELSLREVFSRLLVKETCSSQGSFPFSGDLQYHQQHTPGTCTNYFAHHPGTLLACCIETTYAGNFWRKTSTENLVELGRCVARAIRAATTYSCLPLTR